MNTFLFEIGTEELPAGEVPRAMDALEAHFRKAIEAAGLPTGDIRVLTTPRRLAVTVSEVAAKAPDTEETVTGPPASVAWTADGELSKAALGFAKKQGLDPAQLQRVTTARGEYAQAQVLREGRSATDVLAEAASTSIDAIPWKRKMRWGWGDMAFVRPIHWLVALLGEQVLPVHYGSLQSGRTTRGHRFMAPEPIELASAESYADALRAAYVEPDVGARRAIIQAGLEREAAAASLTLLQDDDLLDEVVHLVEWPVVLLGRFDEALLEVPREVLITSMRTHQRYFALERADGILANAFALVSNRMVEDPSRVVAGNLRVLRARLEDARFFYLEDRKVPLSARFEALRRVTFIEGLGSMADKSGRVAVLADELHKMMSSTGEISLESFEAAVRAAHLCKNDLTTGMVSEFPELQGVMGRYYALHEKEDERVAQAIEEHWLPRGATDPPAASEAGRILAFADRLDTLCGAFAVGLKPTATADPYALRRAALGLLRTAHVAGWNVDLEGAIAKSFELLDQLNDVQAAPDVQQDLIAFLRGRAAAWFADLAHADVVDAVLTVCLGAPHEAEARIRALAQFREDPAFEGLIRAYRRAANILAADGEARTTTVSISHFEHDAERALHAAIQAEKTTDPGNADERARRLAALGEPLEAFFANVMVNADDPAVRGNRLALLHDLQALFLDYADFARLHVGPASSESPA